MGKKKRDPKRAAALAARKQAAKHRQQQNDRERLFALEAGGSARRPRRVESVAVIESRAESTSCPLCDGSHQVLDHQVERNAPVAGATVRCIDMRCRRCRSARKMWFRVETPVPN